MSDESSGQMHHSDHCSSGSCGMLEDFKKRFIVSSILTIPILILSPLVQQILGFTVSFSGDMHILLLLSAAVFFYGGVPFFKGTKSELSKKQPGMMTLIALAIVVAFVYSASVVLGLPGKVFFWELATLIDIMLLGHWIEMRSVMGASGALEKLAKLMPDMALKKKGGKAIDVKISELKKGDIVLIKPGEKIPSDGTITKGKGYVDESMLTGEAEPAAKKKGDKLIGGSVNGDSSFEMRVEKTGEDSYLAKVINLVQEAQQAKSKTQRLADRAAFVLTLVAIAGGIATFLVWSLYSDPAFAIERMVTVMIITCPHALGLAIPLVAAISTTVSAKNGLLVRNRTAFEESRKITTVVFDKTGTLTQGSFGVSSVRAFGEYDEKTVVSYAAAVEQDSEHPIAKGILEKAEEMGITVKEVKDFKNIKGKGVEGTVSKKKVTIASPAHLEKKGILVDKKGGGTEVFVVLGDKAIGAITLSDKIRDESYEAIKSLKKLGIKCVLMTGDNEAVAQDVADELGLDSYFAGVLPHEKQEKIKELQKRGEIVAMAGDGVNDAPALAQADVGIAIGSGTDVAAETADIILVNSDPNDVVSLISFGKKTYSKMRQNLFWATGYNVLAIPLAAGVLFSYGIVISPALGAALMSASTVIVAINAKLLSIGD